MAKARKRPRRKKRTKSDNEAEAAPPRHWYARPRTWIMAGIVAVLLAGGAWGLTVAITGETPEIQVYKTATCGCCGDWVDHLKRNGFAVKVKDLAHLDLIKRMGGVHESLQSCHTAFVSGYTIEGHVPADSIKRLLKEKPSARGLAVPGMPGGSPGMEGADKEPYEVLIFDDIGGAKVYARY
ncbi:MAG: DUF411 domain-containing protein [Rhodospirillales bacterium]|jgi:hypothetical protein|nr:DUF411 domain-containing protein [Rhodospirillales bacterium]MDP6645565.1 DUF411 domain-containing protein [Rhodospirillales bacterium]|tara:strand:- start:166 stop:711 length:546 start_codon:yes stop_codon:yes gene_type:complete